MNLDEYTEERFIKELKDIGVPMETINSSVLASRRFECLIITNYNSSIRYNGKNCGLINYCPKCDKLNVVSGPDGDQVCYDCGCIILKRRF